MAHGTIRSEDDAHTDDAFETGATRTLGIGRLLTKEEGRRHKYFSDRGRRDSEDFALRRNGGSGSESWSRYRDRCDGRDTGSISRDGTGQPSTKRNPTLSFAR
jgi:hypothetical protein